MFTRLTLKEQLLFSTVPIYSESQDSNVKLGTGFIYQDHTGTRTFLVTNKHVIEHAEKGIISFSARQSDVLIPKFGTITEGTITSEFEKFFIKHPNPHVDIAVCEVSKLEERMIFSNGFPFVKSLHHNLVPTLKSFQEDIDAIEEVIFIGYPDGFYDRVHNLPIVRTGITASPIYVDFQNQPCFLIDAQMYEGSSGSPVFIKLGSVFTDRRGKVAYRENRLVFLGIISHMVMCSDEGKPPNRTEKLNLGVVFKSGLIRDFVSGL